MTQDWKNRFFEGLKAKMDTFTAENVLLQNEVNGERLMKTIFAASVEKTSFVLVQAALFQAREDVLLLELYIKLLAEADPGVLGELRQAIEELNYYLPAGCLGICPGDRHVFLRDCFRLNTEQPLDQTVADAVVDYELMMEVVTAAYPGLSAIWSGELTFQQTVEQDMLRRHSG